MTQWTRTIGRNVSNALPAWRTAMTNVGQIYRVSTHTHITDIQPTIVWPGGSRPTKYGYGGDESRLHFGFGAAVHVDDIGPFGALVYGGTGEDTFAQQLSMMRLDTAAPAFEWFQQPFFCRSDAEAITEGADWFYDPTAADAVAANRKMATGYLMPSDWDGGFPVSLPTNIGGQGGGWLIRRKAKLTMGRWQPHCFRYSGPCYIPPSMSGDGDGYILVNTNCPAGPLYFNNAKPSNVGNVVGSGGVLFRSDDYVADFDGSGRHKTFVHACNVRTRQWRRLEGTGIVSVPRVGPADGASFVDRVNKRVYYVHMDDSGGVYYVDFADGIDEATVSAPVSYSKPPGFNGGLRSDTGFGGTEQHPNGRRVAYYQSATVNGKTCVVAVDIDNQKVAMIDLAPRGLDMPFDSYADAGFSYDPATNRLLMIFNAAPDYAPVSQATYYLASWELPADPTVASQYNVTTTTLAYASGVTPEPWVGTFFTNLRDHCRFHPELGVVVRQQKDGPPLAFRPW